MGVSCAYSGLCTGGPAEDCGSDKGKRPCPNHGPSCPRYQHASGAPATGLSQKDTVPPQPTGEDPVTACDLRRPYREHSRFPRPQQSEDRSESAVLFSHTTRG
ncbi:hypothetical protein AAFF_G00133170 [Aldrovandia affinis]|uniref:Uncharacterized protein n=1 Tax=Aldrovandia affinis TaxID=143900 RepID=A0AAD7RQ78_9TELE|nr:hypothetical protein AAFF_G00133170 [Aldrovandia affinis]